MVPRQLAPLLRDYEEVCEEVGFAVAEPYFVAARGGRRQNEGAIRRLFHTTQRYSAVFSGEHLAAAGGLDLDF